MIYKIKQKLKLSLGKKVKVVVYGSRNKKDIYYGIIDSVYNNIFLVKLETNEKKSFCYSDVLIGMVKIIDINDK